MSGGILAAYVAKHFRVTLTRRQCERILKRLRTPSLVVKYFAYGSNMLIERLHQRVKSAKNPVCVTLPGYSLRFHKVSGDGSGKCNMVGPGINGACVRGVVFDVLENEIPALDAAEGVGYGYQKSRVKITLDGKVFDALVYLAERKSINDSLTPYHWYRDLVLAGAEQNCFPDDYVASLRAVVSVEDPRPNRKTRREALAALKAYRENASRVK